VGGQQLPDRRIFRSEHPRAKSLEPSLAHQAIPLLEGAGVREKPREIPKGMNVRVIRDGVEIVEVECVLEMIRVRDHYSDENKRSYDGKNFVTHSKRGCLKRNTSNRACCSDAMSTLG